MAAKRPQLGLAHVTVVPTNFDREAEPSASRDTSSDDESRADE
jgi:hypothetical protein